MAQKHILMKNGISMWVETRGDLWGFQAGDIITKTPWSPLNLWGGQRVRVEGFSSDALIGIIEGEERALLAKTADRLILLERPSLKFKVGDHVRHYAHGLGTVIVLDPCKRADITPQLVEFVDTQTVLHDGASKWTLPWFPDQHKTPSTNRLWCAEYNLTLSVRQTAADVITERDGKKYVCLVEPNAEECEVITTGNLWGFQQDDIITLDRDAMTGGSWRGERIRVVGFSPGGCLYGCFLDGQESGKVRYMRSAYALLLLERPSVRFKVGDKVRVLRGNVPRGTIGTVFCLSPCEHQVFVDFEGFKQGGKFKEFWGQPWYPEKHKTRSSSRKFYMPTGHSWLEVIEPAPLLVSATALEDPAVLAAREEQRRREQEAEEVAAREAERIQQSEEQRERLEQERQELEKAQQRLKQELAYLKKMQEMLAEIVERQNACAPACQGRSPQEESVDLPIFKPKDPRSGANGEYVLSTARTADDEQEALRSIGVWLFHQRKGESEWSRYMRYLDGSKYPDLHEKDEFAQLVNQLVKDDHDLDVEQVRSGLTAVAEQLESARRLLEEKFSAIEEKKALLELNNGGVK